MGRISPAAGALSQMAISNPPQKGSTRTLLFDVAQLKLGLGEPNNICLQRQPGREIFNSGREIDQFQLAFKPSLDALLVNWIARNPNDQDGCESSISNSNALDMHF